MGDEGDGAVTILMRAILNEQIPLKDIIEPNIRLPKGTGLH